MMARLISVCEPSGPRNKKRGKPKNAVFQIAKGCTNIDRCNDITSGVAQTAATVTGANALAATASVFGQDDHITVLLLQRVMTPAV